MLSPKIVGWSFGGYLQNGKFAIEMNIKTAHAPGKYIIFQSQIGNLPNLSRLQVDGISGVSYTHDDFRTLSMKMGSALTRLDTTKGDIVAFVLPNCPEFAFAFYGVVSIGATVCTINNTFTAGNGLVHNFELLDIKLMLMLMV